MAKAKAVRNDLWDQHRDDFTLSQRQEAARAIKFCTDWDDVFRMFSHNPGQDKAAIEQAKEIKEDGIKKLRAYVKPLKDFISILEHFKKCKPAFDFGYGSEARTEELNHEVLEGIKAFHKALCDYLDALAVKSPDWEKVTLCSHRLAALSDPESWSKWIKSNRLPFLRWDAGWYARNARTYFEAVISVPEGFSR